MKNKNRLKKTSCNSEYKVLIKKSALTHLFRGWCTACQGPCDWWRYLAKNKRNNGQKPKNKHKPWRKNFHN